MVGCVQYVVGKKKLLFQFEYGQKRYISYCLLQYLCLKEEVCLEMDEPISNLPENNMVDFLLSMGILMLNNLECLKEVCIPLCFIVCVLLSRYQQICWRDRFRKRDICA